MSDNILFKYSDFYQDDGGFEKIKADFTKLGVDLIEDAKKLKLELSKALTLDDIAGLSKLEGRVASLESTFKKYGDTKKGLAKIEQEYIKALQEEAKLEGLLEKNKQSQLQTTKKEIEAQKALEQGIQAENNAKKSKIALSEAERRASEAAAKSSGIVRGAYSMLSAELRKLFTESANVASEMFILEQAGKKATPAYEKLQKTFDALAQKTNRLDGALKTIDANLGRHQRNVGNYASGYNGLGNSINQLTRELPAFTYSATTGILALSNNIPILTDEIGRMSRANVELVAAGKPAVSILGQIARAVFSLQTAMGLGILAATVYADEIVEWTKSLFGADEALKNITESQKLYNDARIEGKKASLDEKLALKQNLAVAKNDKLTLEERRIAIKNIVDAYPFYFKALTEAQFLAGQTTEAEEALRQAIEKRAKANKLSEVVVKGKSRIIDLQIEIATLDKLSKKEKEFRQQQGDFLGGAEGEASRDRQEKADKRLITLRKELNFLAFENAVREKEIIKLRSESIGLDDKIEKAKKDKKTLRDQQINNVDYLASDFEFQKALLENTIATNEGIFNSAKYTAEQRIEAQKLMVSQLLALNELEKREELRLLKNKFDKERNETIKDGEGKIIANKYTKNGLLELEKQYNFDKQTIITNSTGKEREILKKGEEIMLLDRKQFQIENLKLLQKNFSVNSEIYQAYSRKISAIQNEINNIIDQPKGLELSDKLKINQAELDRLTKLNEELQKISGGKSFSQLNDRERALMLKKIEAFEAKQTDIQKDAEMQRRLNRLQSITEEQKAFEVGTNEWKQLELERQAILKAIKEDEIKTQLDANKKILDAAKKMTEDWKTLLEAVLDKMVEVARKRVESNEKLVENQKETITKQEELARAGLENTLAFEQQQLAKREAALARSQRKQEKLEKVKSLYSSYSNYSSKGDENALAKALRDFAVLEAIAASFGDGGIVDAETIAKQNGGIMRGPSHKSRRRGIHILAEGDEGIFSRREMRNLGKDNFYRMKELAGNGKVDTNFFGRQRKQFNTMVVAPGREKNILDSREIVDAIRNQPKQEWDKAQVVGDFIQIVETILKPGGKVRNTYKFKKPRL